MAHFVKVALSSLLLVTSSVAISFREQPESRTVGAGETVQLYCSVNNQVDVHLYWQNLDTAAYISLNDRISPYGQLNRDQLRRYQITGNAERGEYYLRIQNVTKQDEGRYACVFFLNFNYYSQVAKLKVVRPPDRGYPKCTVEPINRPTVGDNITLVCESRGGDPPATLSWVRGTTRLVTKRGRHSKGDPVIQYSMTLTEDDSDVRFTCVANNQALQQPRTCSLTPLRSSLGVMLLPVVASVEVGDSFKFVCVTERMPNLVYQWYINDTPIDGRETRFTYIRGGQQLRIEAVTLEDDYALVKCEVTQKDYSYTGSAVGLLWVQNSVSTPDILEATSPTTQIPIRRVTNLRSLFDRTTTSKATTAATTTTATTRPVTTTAATPSTTSATTTKQLITRVASTRSETLVPVILNNPSVADSESSESSLSSSYSSVSSLSSEDHEATASETEGQLENNLHTDGNELKSSSDTTPDPEVNDIDNEERRPSGAVSVTEDVVSTDTAADGQLTTAAANEIDNAIDQSLGTPDVTATVNQNEIAGDLGSGLDISNDVEGLTMFTDTGPKLPNEAGIGYNSDRLRGTPNWGLIAGLFVVFLLVIIAVSALAVYLYRRKGKESKQEVAT
ncbi:uncharacterized protein [Diadema antillarum]|uniref:uncharacterized protein n=1 Tax=Diadema antillarum TaxID=105358 RepID=UPI003A87D7FC